MAKPKIRPWKVLEHGPLEQLAENLWRVEGAIPDMPLRRHMIIIRSADGRLILHNGICVDENVLQQIEALGEIAFLVVPNGWHRLDAAAWKSRYPDLEVVCPRGGRDKVEEVVRVDRTYDELEPFGGVSCEHLEGLAEAEGVWKVRSRDGTTLVFNDAIFNQPHLPGLFGFIYRLIGSSGSPKVTRLMRLWAVKDKKAMREHLLRLAETPDLVRVIPAHIAIIDERPDEVLRAIAHGL